MRTPVELIHELRAGAEGAESAALIVGFAHSIGYVFADDPRALNALDEAINNGGNPLGILRCLKQSGTVVVEAGPLQEYEQDDDIRIYLEGLMAEFSRMLRREDQGDAS